MWVKRHVLIKITAMAVSALLFTDPFIVRASEALQLPEGITGEGIDAQAIYDSIDREKLRATIDVEELRALIDEDELLAQIDENELKEELARRQQQEAAEKEENNRERFGVESGTIALEPPEEELPPGIVKVEFPVIDNKDVFDFIMDPLGLVYMTGAAKYGGGNVEENASVLFRNTDNEYLFSSVSDYLTIKNKGNLPVKVIVKASITGAKGLVMTGDKDFGGSADPALYLALVDNEGNEMAVVPGRETVLESVLVAPSGYKATYKWNQETGQYEDVSGENAKEDPFEGYSFALTGTCNPIGSWNKVSAKPSIVISWSAEALSDEELREALSEPGKRSRMSTVDMSSEEEIADGGSEEVIAEDGEPSNVGESSDVTDWSEFEEVDVTEEDGGEPSEAPEDSEGAEDTAGTNTADSDTAGMDTAGTNTAGSDTAGMDTAGTNTAGTNTAGPDQAEVPGDANASNDAEASGDSVESGQKAEHRRTLEEEQLEQLRREKLEQLKEQKLRELIEERLEQLVREEFERLCLEALEGRIQSGDESEFEEITIEDNG